MFHRLDHRAGHYLLLITVWAVVCLPNLGGPSLWDIDEGNNVTCFSEMLHSGNLIVPTFNGSLREDKPVLLYWLQIASSHLFGVNEWAGRFPSAVAALLVVLTLYELGRQTFGVRTGLLAGVILATSFSPIGAAHFANPDALLLAFTTLALTLFWHDYRTGGRGWLAGVGVAAGLAVLAKGPIGLVMPIGVVFLFLAWQHKLLQQCDIRIFVRPRRLLPINWRRKLSGLWDWRIPGLILAFFLVAAPWYVWVGVETKGAWLRGFWYKHHVDRMATPLENHSGPFWYYLVVLMVGLAPWSIFFAPTIWQAWRRLRTPEEPGGVEQAAVRFLLVWCGVYFVFFSVVKTKLPNYILPIYPAISLLTAHVLERWRRGEAVLPAWMVRTSLTCLALIGVGLVVGLLFASGLVPAHFMRGRSFPALAAWLWLGAVPMVGASVGWRLFVLGRRGGVIVAVAVSAVLFVAPAAGWALGAIDSQKAARIPAQALPADQTRREVRLATHGYTQPSLVFYCRREVLRCEKPENAFVFLQVQLPSYLFVPQNVWAEMEARSPVKTRVVARHYDMYSGQTILVVTNQSQPGEQGLVGKIGGERE